MKENYLVFFPCISVKTLEEEKEGGKKRQKSCQCVRFVFPNAQRC